MEYEDPTKVFMWCVNNKICRKQMSTPADNTRYYTRSKKSHGGHSTLSKVSGQKVSVKLFHDDSVEQDNSAKNDYVKKWLLNSVGNNYKLSKQPQDGSVKSNVNTTEDSNSCYNTASSQESHEVCFNLNKARFEKGADYFQMSVNAKHERASATSKSNEGDISVGLGSSASVTSRMLQRRQTRVQKMKGMRAYLNPNDSVLPEKPKQTDWDEVIPDKNSSEHQIEQEEVVEQDVDADENENSQQNSNEVESEQEQENGDPKEGPLPKEEINILDNFKKRLEDDDKTVIGDMFELLITKMSKIESEITTVKRTQKKVSEKVTTLENSLDFYGQSIDELDADIVDLGNANCNVVQSIIKIEAESTGMKKRLLAKDRQYNKGFLVIKGIEIKKDSTLKQDVSDFFKKVMKIESDITIATVRKIAKSKGAPLLIKLRHPEEVGLIYSNVSNLKGKKNKFKKPYNIRDYQPDEDREMKNRERDIVMENRRLPTSHQATIAYDKGILHIDQKRYKKEVEAPAIKDVLLLSDEEGARIDSLPVAEMGSKALNGSKFIAYAAEVKSHQAVKDAYLHVKAQHISATHIMSGYRIFGHKFYTLQDYSDDGEHFGGKCILNQLKEAKIWNFAVFIVRYHNGPNLGRVRFDIISDLTKDALASYKKALNYGQNFREQDLLGILNKSAVPQKENKKDNEQSDITSQVEGT